MLWEILTPNIREEIYQSQISRWLFSEEQNRSHKRTIGTGDQQIIGQFILNESNRKM